MPNYVFINGQMYNADALAHHGIKGMKWGVRRYQNKDGSLTPAGKKRSSRTTNYDKIQSKKAVYDETRSEYKQLRSDYKTAKKTYRQAKKSYRKERRKMNDAYVSEVKTPLRMLDAMLTDKINGGKRINELLNKNKSLTVSQARKQVYVETGAVIAAGMIAKYGARAVKSLMTPKAQVFDVNGNVIKNIYR